jgi:hypothetical protein
MPLQPALPNFPFSKWGLDFVDDKNRNEDFARKVLLKAYYL